MVQDEELWEEERGKKGDEHGWIKETVVGEIFRGYRLACAPLLSSSTYLYGCHSCAATASS